MAKRHFSREHYVAALKRTGLVILITASPFACYFIGRVSPIISASDYSELDSMIGSFFFFVEGFFTLFITAMACAFIALIGYLLYELFDYIFPKDTEHE